MASHYRINRPTVYKLLAEAGKVYQKRYSELTDLQLDSVVREIKQSHPNAGETNVIGHRRARNIRVLRREYVIQYIGLIQKVHLCKVPGHSVTEFMKHPAQITCGT